MPGLHRPSGSNASLMRCIWRHVRLREDQRHQVLLLHADAVLAAQRAAGRGAHAHDLGARVDHPLLGAGHVGVPQDQRVQVAVAGVEDVGDAEARFARDLLDARQRRRQLGARHHAVDGVVVGREPADRGKRAFAARPERGALGVVLGQPHVERAVVAAHLVDGLPTAPRPLRRRPSTSISTTPRRPRDNPTWQRDSMARMVRLSIISMAAGMMRRAIMPATAELASSIVVEDGQDRLDRFADRHQPDPDAGDDAERAFGADDQAGQVVAGRVRGAAAELDDLAVGQDHFQAQGVVGGHAVAQGVRPTRVLADVAADGARLLAGRIGHIRQAERGRRLAEADVDHARLDDRAHVVDVDLQDAVMRARLIRTPPLMGIAPPREARSRAARRVRHTRARLHARTMSLTSRADSGKTTAGGPMLVDRPVVLVEHQVVVAPQHLLRRQQRPQFLDDRGVWSRQPC